MWARLLLSVVDTLPSGWVKGIFQYFWEQCSPPPPHRGGGGVFFGAEFAVAHGLKTGQVKVRQQPAMKPSRPGIMVLCCLAMRIQVRGCIVLHPLSIHTLSDELPLP